MHLALTTLYFCRVPYRDDNSPLTLSSLTHPPILSLLFSPSTAHIFFSAPPVCSSSLSHWFWHCSSAVGWDLICLPGLMSLISRAEQLLAPQVIAVGAINWCLWVKGARIGECFRDGQCCRFSTHLFAPQLGWLSLFPPFLLCFTNITCFPQLLQNRDCDLIDFFPLFISIRLSHCFWTLLPLCTGIRGSPITWLTSSSVAKVRRGFFTSKFVQLSTLFCFVSSCLSHCSAAFKGTTQQW